jgi:hypothetical protein
VPEHDRRRERQLRLLHGEVGVADAARGELHDDFLGPGRGASATRPSTARGNCRGPLP